MAKDHEMPTLNPLITKISSSQVEINPHRRWNNMLRRRMQDYDFSLFQLTPMATASSVLFPIKYMGPQNIMRKSEEKQSNI